MDARYPSRPGLMVRAAGAVWLESAFRGRWALPAFNVANLETIQAVLRAADECGSPVILQISPGAIAFAGYESIMGAAFREADRAATSVVVHLDHCREPDTVRRAMRDGFGSVMFDGSRLAHDDNVRYTKALAAEGAAIGCAVEGELGTIGGREDTTLEAAKGSMTTPEAAAEFVEATGVHVLAPALGTVHRMPEDSVEIDEDAIRRIAAACDRPLALHGGTGIRRSQLRGAVEAGIAKVNISSAVSRSLATGIRRAWKNNPEELDLRRYMAEGREEVRRLAIAYIELCGSGGRHGPAGDRRDPVLDNEPE